MRHLVPPFVLEQAAAGRDRGQHEGAAFFVDVSGFTSVSERLSVRGTAGAEELAELMNGVFEPIVAWAYGFGGVIPIFAGDSMLAVFLGEDGPDRAVRAAREIQSHFQDLGPTPTSLGPVRIQVKLGVARGSVCWSVVTSEDGSRRAFWFHGSAVVDAAVLQSGAEPGAVRLGPGIVEPAWTETVWPVPSMDDHLELAPSFFPAHLFMDSGLGEFRRVVSVFIGLPDCANEEQTRAFVNELFRLKGEFGGFLRHIDVSEKGTLALLYWGAPTARRDDLSMALRFSMELRRRSALDLRVGITRGQVYAGPMGALARSEYGCYGLMVNLAARVMMEADPGQILVDGSLVESARQFEWSGVGARSFKGFENDVPVFELVCEAHVEHLELPLRKRERRELAAALEGLELGRPAGWVVLRGDSGVGKSWLLQSQANRSTVPWFTSRTIRAVFRPLHPFRAFLADWAGLDPQQHPEEGRERLRVALVKLGDASLVRELDFLCSVLGLPRSEAWNRVAARERAVRVRDALIQWTQRVAPAVFLMEPLVGLDSDTLELFEGLIQRGVPVGLVGKVQPGEAIPDGSSVIELGPLDEEEQLCLIQHHLGGNPSPELMGWLRDTSGGNTFFIEQILWFLESGGLLQPDEAGVIQLTSRPDTLPPDVQGAVISRLDQLDRDVRRVVQAASVVGLQFHVRVLSQVVDTPMIQERIETARTASIWQPEDSSRYAFTHARIREVAYGMQLHSSVRAVHGRVADAIEQVFGHQLEAHIEDLAWHRARGGQFKQAIRALNQAASWAMTRGEIREALGHLNAALALLSPDLDPDGAEGLELGIQVGLGAAQIALIGPHAPQTRAAYQRAHELSALAPSSVEGFQALFGLRTEALFRGDHRRSMELARLCQSFAQALGDDHADLEIHNMMANGMMWQGQLEQSAWHAERVLKGFNDHHHAQHVARFAQDPRVTVHYPMMIVSWLRDGGLGAATSLQRSLALADRLGQPFGRALIRNTLATLGALQGRPEEVRGHAEALVELCQLHGFPVYEASGRIILDWLAATGGDVGATRRIDLNIQRLVGGGMVLARSVNMWMLSDALRLCGDLEESRAVANRAVEQSREQFEFALVPDLLRLAHREDEALQVAQGMGADHIVSRTQKQISERGKIEQSTK